MTETRSMLTCHFSYRQCFGKPHSFVYCCIFAPYVMRKYNTQICVPQFTVVTVSALEIGAV